MAIQNANPVTVFGLSPGPIEPVNGLPGPRRRSSSVVLLTSPPSLYQNFIVSEIDAGRLAGYGTFSDGPPPAGTLASPGALEPSTQAPGTLEHVNHAPWRHRHRRSLSISSGDPSMRLGNDFGSNENNNNSSPSHSLATTSASSDDEKAISVSDKLNLCLSNDDNCRQLSWMSDNGSFQCDEIHGLPSNHAINAGNVTESVHPKHGQLCKTRSQNRKNSNPNPTLDPEDPGGTGRKLSTVPVAKKEDNTEQETACNVASQFIIPFLIAGCGTVGAGALLDIVQHWKISQDVPEIMTLVPALLGLKGNLEMTSVSRLSTMVNMETTGTHSKTKYLVTNMSLVQCQAIVVGFLAAILASLLNFLKTGEFNASNICVLCASSLFTACLATLVLDSALVLVIFYAKRHKINPDNIATPIAASFGDILTLAIFAGSGTLFNNMRVNTAWTSYAAIVFLISLLPLWICLCIKMAYAQQVLKEGWPPIILSMIISSGGGFILNITINKFAALAAFQPVVNENPQARIVRMLLAFVLPGHLIFMLLVVAVKKAHTDEKVFLTCPFVLLYLTAGFIQVLLLLYICILLSNILWRLKVNPDNSTIPIMTALGDLFGTGLLAAVFFILRSLGDPNSIPVLYIPLATAPNNATLTFKY